MTVHPLEVYHILDGHYGALNWWPAESPYEMVVGAVLTQNTNWRNVEKAIDRLKARDCLNPRDILNMDAEELAELIRPAGFHKQKAGYIHNLTSWFVNYDGQALPMERIRKELLAIKGIGQETADCILVYALELPSFVIDAYTMRIFGRLGLVLKGYNAYQNHFHAHLPRDVALYNQYHALIVQHAKIHCTKSNPSCTTCPLNQICPFYGGKH